MKDLIILLFFSLFFMSACSNCKISKTDLGTNVEITDLQTWLNLMPGGNPSFHFSGEYKVTSGNPENFTLKNVKVFSDKEELYSVIPSVRDKYNESSMQSSLEFQFFSESGLAVKAILLTKEKLDFVLEFDIEGNLINKFVEQVELVRAY